MQRDRLLSGKLDIGHMAGSSGGHRGLEMGTKNNKVTSLPLPSVDLPANEEQGHPDQMTPG